MDDYFDLHSGGGLSHTSDRTLAKLGTSKIYMYMYSIFVFPSQTWWMTTLTYIPVAVYLTRRIGPWPSSAPVRWTRKAWVNSCVRFPPITTQSASRCIRNTGGCFTSGCSRYGRYAWGFGWLILTLRCHSPAMKHKKTMANIFQYKTPATWPK